MCQNCVIIPYAITRIHFNRHYCYHCYVICIMQCQHDETKVYGGGWGEVDRQFLWQMVVFKPIMTKLATLLVQCAHCIIVLDICSLLYPWKVISQVILTAIFQVPGHKDMQSSIFPKTCSHFSRLRREWLGCCLALKLQVHVWWIERQTRKRWCNYSGAVT